MSVPRQPLLDFVSRVPLGMTLTIHSREAAVSSLCAFFGSVSSEQLADLMRPQCFAAQLQLGLRLRSGRTWDRNQSCTKEWVCCAAAYMMLANASMLHNWQKLIVWG